MSSRSFTKTWHTITRGHRYSLCLDVHESDRVCCASPADPTLGAVPACDSPAVPASAHSVMQHLRPAQLPGVGPDPRAETRPRNLLCVHPAPQCPPMHTHTPSTETRRPSAKPPQQVADGQGRCGANIYIFYIYFLRLASCPRPRPSGHVVVVVVGRAPHRLPMFERPAWHRLRVFGAQSVSRRFHEAKSIDFKSDQLQVV